MTTPGARPPRRKAEIPPLRRTSRNVLVIGTVVAVLAAFGPLWAVRVGLLVAVCAAIVACVSAWRELSETRRAHAAEMLAASRTHGTALSDERRQHASVLDALTGRVTAVKAEAQQAQTRIVELTSSVVGLTSTIASLRSEIVATRERYAQSQQQVQERASVIAALEESVRSREAELLALSEANGQVRSIPRRVLAEPQPTEDHGAADELSSDDRRPQVANLVDVAVVLPNYEGERKLA